MTACIVTRGNVDLTLILDTLAFPAVVWDNSRERDFKVYGRYMAMRRARTEYVYFQDDDCLVPTETQQALALFARRGRLVANMPADRDGVPYPWLGWGSIVHRLDAERALGLYLDGYDGTTTDFRLVGCDIAVASIIPSLTVRLPFQHLPYAFDTGRVWTDPGHARRKSEAHDRCVALCA